MINFDPISAPSYLWTVCANKMILWVSLYQTCKLWCYFLVFGENIIDRSQHMRPWLLSWLKAIHTQREGHEFKSCPKPRIIDILSGLIAISLLACEDHSSFNLISAVHILFIICSLSSHLFTLRSI